VGATLSLALQAGVSPLAHYSFDDVADLENDGVADHDLVNGGAVTFDGATPKFGLGAASFPGTEPGYFDVPLKSLLRSDVGSASFWVKTSKDFSDHGHLFWPAPQNLIHVL